MYELHKHRAKVQVCKTTCKLDPLNGLQLFYIVQLSAYVKSVLCILQFEVLSPPPEGYITLSRDYQIIE